MDPEHRSAGARGVAALIPWILVAAGACAPAPSTPPAVAPTPTEEAPAPAGPTSAPPAASSTSDAAPPPPRKGPADAAECKAMVGSTTLEKTDAKVTPGEGAGKSDRFAGIVAAIQEKRPALRCCYELWAKDNPRKDARVVLDFLLDEEGLPTEVQLLRAKSDKLGDDVEACIVDVAMAIPYPKSPSARTTTFEYELGFKHHKAPAKAP